MTRSTRESQPGSEFRRLTSDSSDGELRGKDTDALGAASDSGLDVLMTVDEVAAALRVSAQFVYRHASDGDLPCVNIGKTVRIKLAVVQAVIDGSLVLGQPKPSGGRRARRLRALPEGP